MPLPRTQTTLKLLSALQAAVRAQQAQAEAKARQQLERQRAQQERQRQQQVCLCATPQPLPVRCCSCVLNWHSDCLTARSTELEGSGPAVLTLSAAFGPEVSLEAQPH